MKNSMRGAFAALAAVSWLSTSVMGAVNVYRANLDGASESPPNASPGTGFALVSVDTIANTMRVRASFADLIGLTTAAHIHAPTAVPMSGNVGVATQTPSFSGFPLGVSSGSMDMTFDMTLASSFRAGFITDNGGTVDSARAVLFASFGNGRAYFNIHTSMYPGGEIRGFFSAVPLPGAGMLGLAGLGVVAGVRRRIG